jgi:predicted N-acetyltransferase YhbS
VPTHLTDLPPALAKKPGRYPLVPAVLLGRLAVDSRRQGQGLCTLLLMNALRRVLRTGIGVKLMLVDALHEKAATFYEHFEFIRFADAPLRLYLPVSAICDLFPEDVAASSEAGS